MKEKWLGVAEPLNLLDYVSGFRFKLRRACELANEKLGATQRKLKSWYDRRARDRVFATGD